MKRPVRQLGIHLVVASLALLVACGQVTDPSVDQDRDLVDKRATERLRGPADPTWLGHAPPPGDVPATPDELVAAVLAAHDARDPQRYAKLVHDGYLFLRSDGGVYERAVDLSILTKMMVGRAGQDGTVIASMATELFGPLGVWSDVTASDPYFSEVPGAVSRAYEARFRYGIDGSDATLEVTGLVILYAAPIGDGYRLLGLVDMTYGAKDRSEAIDWTGVRARFE
jgi:hypothetical protein